MCKYRIFVKPFLILVLLFYPFSLFSLQNSPGITSFDFSNIILNTSEQGGRFSNDNWVSNETSYLEILELIDDFEISGGAYIGVGPNQNFTYIANIKPEIAFIVDVREQNTLQHLIYKVIFELSDSRAEFFSFLFSKPLDAKIGPTENTDINGLIQYFRLAGSDRDMFENTFNTIKSILSKKYGFKFTSTQLISLEKIFRAFYIYNLNITYSNSRSIRSWYPTYSELLTQKNNKGEQLNPFNSREDFIFLKNMHLQNRIIPVTGNFSGNKAFRKISEYLDNYNIEVSAIYVSNVEQYVFRSMIDWNNWVSNVKYLPLNEKAVFIRWIYHRSSSRNRDFTLYGRTRLQWIKLFLENYEADKYGSYYDLTILDYIN
ncbi:hypothetical protein ACFL7D_10520 [candidate division KSB1 bacterium]